ncbi:hypothetical protein Bca101_093375 [Brassica carinata]
MRPQQSFTFVSFTTGASGASILFGFLHALLCVFSAKVLAASFSFWIGRLFDMKPSQTRRVRKNLYR